MLARVIYPGIVFDEGCMHPHAFKLDTPTGEMFRHEDKSCATAYARGRICSHQSLTRSIRLRCVSSSLTAAAPSRPARIASPTPVA